MKSGTRKKSECKEEYEINGWLLMYPIQIIGLVLKFRFRYPIITRSIFVERSATVPYARSQGFLHPSMYNMPEIFFSLKNIKIRKGIGGIMGNWYKAENISISPRKTLIRIWKTSINRTNSSLIWMRIKTVPLSRYSVSR